MVGGPQADRGKTKEGGGRRSGKLGYNRPWWRGQSSAVSAETPRLGGARRLKARRNALGAQARQRCDERRLRRQPACRAPSVSSAVVTCTSRTGARWHLGSGMENCFALQPGNAAGNNIRLHAAGARAPALQSDYIYRYTPDTVLCGLLWFAKGSGTKSKLDESTFLVPALFTETIVGIP